MKRYELPTGYLFTDDYEKGQLETLSIGDYGKTWNVKADFLGLSRPLDGVPNRPCMPLQEKWVVTVSTQYGCPMRCTFCDVPNLPFAGNVSFDDLKKQLYSALACFPSVTYTERLNLHFARMGDPIFNEDVFRFATWLATEKKKMQDEVGLRIEVIHPVLTTSLPRKLRYLQERLIRWCNIKNDIYNGQAGLQFSINSTSESQRDIMFSKQQISLKGLSVIADQLPYPLSRKYCLNFAYATDFEIDANLLRSLFDPQKFMVKITPIHNNNACREHQIRTLGGYDSYAPYALIENQLREAGFDVLVFIPSLDEEHGLVTCGNAILGGSQLSTAGRLNIEGQSSTLHGGCASVTKPFFIPRTI